jgi:hypothetical protein
VFQPPRHAGVHEVDRAAGVGKFLITIQHIAQLLLEGARLSGVSRA